MIITTIRKYAFDFFLVVFGASTGFFMLPFIVSSSHWLQDMYDDTNPPSDMKIIHYEYIDKQTLRIQFQVKRNRNCIFNELEGYTGIDAEGAYLSPAVVLKREDGYQPLSYPLGVTIISPPWIMSPVVGPRVLLYGIYLCENRQVRVKVIDTVLRP